MADEHRTQITLPSGRTAQILKARKARHQRNAQRVAGRDQAAVPFALIAEICLIDHQAVTLEDVLELDLDDALILQAKVFGADEGNGEAAAAPATPTAH